MQDPIIRLHELIVGESIVDKASILHRNHRQEVHELIVSLHELIVDEPILKIK